MPAASSWTAHDGRAVLHPGRLLELGVSDHAVAMLLGRDSKRPRAVRPAPIRAAKAMLPCGTLVLVTGRLPNDSASSRSCPPRALLQRCTRIGDCLAPGLIADAVYSGHRFAREFGENAASCRSAANARRSGACHDRADADRRRGRPARTRAAAASSSGPWKQCSRPYAPIEVLSADHVTAIHEAALRCSKRSACACWTAGAR